MKKIICALALSTATIASPAAASTLFTFDTGNSFVLVNSNPTQCLGSCDLTASVITPLTSFSLDVGQSYTFDFARFIVGPGFGTGSATVDAQLAFLTPGTSSAGTGGDANYLRLGGFFTPGVTAGSLLWDTPSQQVTTSDGTVYTVSFGNLTGAQFGGDSRAPVTVRLDSAVPEPSTWAMMIVGFAMIAFALRRRSSRALRPALA